MSKKNTGNLIGLSPRAEAVYLAILRGGTISQSDIAVATKINRTSLTPHISHLLRENLISKTVKGKRLYYSAENPTKLFNYAEKKFSNFELLLPQLVETYKTVGKKPTITFRDGAVGLYQATLDAVQEGNYLKSFSSPRNFLSVLTRKDADKFIGIIEERNIPSKTLTSHAEEDLNLVETFPSPNTEWRPMPPGISYPVEFLIYNQTTVITSWQRQFAVVIESEDITKFVESIFDYFWKIAK